MARLNRRLGHELDTLETPRYSNGYSASDRIALRLVSHFIDLKRIAAAVHRTVKFPVD
jgi:hypothetical protein